MPSPFKGSSDDVLGNDVEMVGDSNQLRGSHRWLNSLLDQEIAKLRPELKAKVIEWQDAIHPHTEEGGDPYYIGDAYEPINADCASEWRLPKYGIGLSHLIYADDVFTVLVRTYVMYCNLLVRFRAWNTWHIGWKSLLVR